MQQNQNLPGGSGQSQEQGSVRQRQSEQQQKQQLDPRQQPGQKLSAKELQEIDRDHGTDKQ